MLTTTNQKKCVVAVLISNRVDFRAMYIVRDKKSNFMTKKSIYQEGIAILNVYVHHNRASKYLKPKLIELQKEINTHL